MADEAFMTEVAFLASTVPNLGTFAVPYPAGSSQSDFAGVGSIDAHEIVINDNDRYLALMGEMSVAFNSLSITVTNKSGVTWPALATAALLFDLSNVSSGGQVRSVNGKTGIVMLTAVDIADLAAVAESGDYADLANRPTLGSAAAQDASAFATAAQGTKADAALPATSLDVARAWSAPQRPAPAVLTSGATITANVATKQAFTLSLGENTTLNFSNMSSAVGTQGRIAGNIAATGVTLTLGTNLFPVGGAITPALPANVGDKFRIDYDIVSSTRADVLISPVGV